MSIPSFSAFPEIPQRSTPEADFDAKMYALFQHFATTHRHELLAFIQFLENNVTAIEGAINGVTIGLTHPTAAKFTSVEVAGSPGVLAALRDGVASNFLIKTAGNKTTIGNAAGSSILALMAGNQEAIAFDSAGRASGAAVQSNFKDPTNGRLLRMFDHVGPFDLGSRRTEVVGGSLNDTMDQGYTRFLAWNTEATDTPWNYGLGLQIMAYDTTGNQLAFRRGAYPAMAFRGTTDANLNFSEWLELFHTHNIVGTVGQTDGTPTGAVVERGSNANGEYVRFADGTQICTHELTLGAPNVAHGNNYTDASATTWVYPATFANGASVSGHNVDVGNCWLSAYGNSNSQTSLRSMRAVSTSVAPTFRLMAIGRWF